MRFWFQLLSSRVIQFMNKLRQEGNKYFIGSDKHFQNGNTFKNETIKKVIDKLKL